MTEDDKHTAGPWHIEGSRGSGVIISAGINAEGDGPASYVGVIDPMFHVAGEGNLRANARLIAAAPDLLEALKELLGMGELFIPTKLDAPGFQRARAAIAKAGASHG